MLGKLCVLLLLVSSSLEISVWPHQNLNDISSLNSIVNELISKDTPRNQSFKEFYWKSKGRTSEKSSRNTFVGSIIDDVLATVVECDKPSDHVQNLARDCQAEREVIYNNQLEMDSWAFEIEDSNGVESSGRFQGRSTWFGEFDQCKQFSADVNFNATMEKWKGSYVTLVYQGIGTPPNILDFFLVGYCASPRCQKFTEAINSYNISDESCSVPLGSVGFFQTRPFKPVKDDKHFIGGLVFFSFFGALVLFGTVYDYFSKTSRENEKSESFILKILRGFSAYTNLSKLLNTNIPKGSFTAVHGIRAISISWVVLGHSYFVSFSSTGNVAKFGRFITEQPLFQGIANATLSVDTFFVLSGFLATYLFLRELEKRKYKLDGKTIFMYYFHRFWRLIPMLAAIIVFATTIYPRVVTGPRDIKVKPPVLDATDTCRKYWWRTLLFISNFFENNDICPAHTWYLSVDMQLYIVLGIILFFFALSPFITVFLLFGFLSSHLISTPILLQKVIDRRNTVGANMDLDDLLYRKPWARSGPYAMGAVFGLLMHKFKKPKIPIFLAMLGWILAIGGGVTIVYIRYMEVGKDVKRWSKAGALAYTTLYRPLWGLCVCWVIWACHHGYGGIINHILSIKFFIPISRMGYGIYIFHWEPQLLFQRFQKYSRHLSHLNIVYDFFGHMTVAVTLGTVASLLFDSPFVNLEKLLFFGKKDKISTEKKEEKEINPELGNSTAIVDEKSFSVPMENMKIEGISYVPVHINEGFLKDEIYKANNSQL